MDKILFIFIYILTFRPDIILAIRYTRCTLSQKHFFHPELQQEPTCFPPKTQPGGQQNSQFSLVKNPFRDSNFELYVFDFTKIRKPPWVLYIIYYIYISLEHKENSIIYQNVDSYKFINLFLLFKVTAWEEHSDVCSG